MFLSSSLILLNHMSGMFLPQLVVTMGVMTPFMVMMAYSEMEGSLVMSDMLCMKDGVTVSMMVLTWWISILMIISSNFSVFSKGGSSSFKNLIILLSILLFFSFSLENILLFYCAFELTLVPTVLLILNWGYQPERVEASMFMVLYTMVASLFFLFFLLLIWGWGEVSFMLEGSKMNSLVILAFFAFLVKLPIFGFHVWLPKAHVEAPLAGSMILAAVLLKLGFYGLYRLLDTWFISASFFMSFLISFSMLGGLITCMLCFRAVDMKKMIAYSSVGHMSLIIPCLISKSAWGSAASILIAVSHGFSSSCLFYVANLLYEKSGSRSLLVNKGFLSVYPSLFMFIMVVCSVNMGVPPSINYLSEVMSYCVLVTMGYSLTAIAMMVGLVTGGFSMYLYLSLCHGPFSRAMVNINLVTAVNYLSFLMHIYPSFLLIFWVKLIV